MRILRPLFLFLLCSRCATGQDFNYTHYDVKDGLAGSVVYCAAEDRDGFLWFGTETGLSRFDGTHFKNFTAADGLPENEVLKLFVDSKNRIWMTLFKNAICYYWKGKIYNRDNDSLLRRLSIHSFVNWISEDRAGNILFLEGNAIHILYRSGRFRDVYLAETWPVQQYEKGNVAGDGQYYLFVTTKAGRGVCRLTDIAGHPRLVLVKDGILPLNGNQNAMLIGLDYFITVQDTSLLYLPLAGKGFEMTVPTASNSLSLFSDTVIAINTTSGCFAFNLRTRKQTARFLEGQSVNAVFVDSEGNTWFVCAGGGIFRMGSIAFRNVRLQEQDAGRSVSCIRKIDGSLLIGTERALCRVDPLLQTARALPVNGTVPMYRRIVTIDKMNRDSLLIGIDGGLAILSKTIFSAFMPGQSIKSVSRVDHDHWLVSSASKTFSLRLPGFRIEDTVWNGRSTCSFKRDSIYYIGTLDGLLKVSPGGRCVALGDKYPVFRTRIADIKETADGMLWVATYGSGIAGYGPDSLLYVLTEKDGLNSRICRTLAVSGNELWVGTDKGISRIRRKGSRFDITRFGTADGLPSDMINTLYADSARVYVGTSQGLTWFDADHVTAHSFCKLRVTSIQTAAHEWMYDTSCLVLPHRDNSIRVDFVAISFRSVGDIEYRYRLLGLSDAWHITRETFVSYPTLPSGGYTLELTAVNKFGVHSLPIRVHFMVEKSLPEKGWFITLLAVLAGALLWLLVSMRIRYIKKINQEKLNTNARIAELEQMALKAQMNPHFIFNSLNSIQQYVIDRDFKGVNKFITDFSRLIRLTLDISSKARISVEEEVKYLSTYLELEKSRFENKFTYQVELGEGVDPLGYQIPPMILQPYVENSIRHGVRNRDDNDGKITIRFVKQAPCLVCTVEDNGVGRSAAEKFKGQVLIEYQSRGMALTASRVEMFNRSNAAAIGIHIEDVQTNEGLAAGTKVIIRFPLQDIIKPTSN